MYGLRDDNKNMQQPLVAQPSAPMPLSQAVPLNYTSPDVIDRRQGQPQTMADKLRDATIKARDIGNTMWRQIQHPSELQ